MISVGLKLTEKKLQPLLIPFFFFLLLIVKVFEILPKHSV